MSKVATLTAETAEGRCAIAEVMAHSYQADISEVPPQWARARVIDGVPVSYIIVDPLRFMDHPAGDLPYAFICDVATRADRRNEGHFTSIMLDTFTALRDAGVSLVVTHGRHQLYRRLGFDVFTHHSGILLTPEQIISHIGLTDGVSDSHTVVIQHGNGYLPDLLVVTGVVADTELDAIHVLRYAASQAVTLGKQRILIEYPPAPSYGSRYPIYASLDTYLGAIAKECGAELRVERAKPEVGTIPDADWLKVLDVPNLLRLVIRHVEGQTYRNGAIRIETDAGSATLMLGPHGVSVQDTADLNDLTLRLNAVAVGHLVTGYIEVRAAIASAMSDCAIPDYITAALTSLFPSCWRLSRNESWTYSR